MEQQKVIRPPITDRTRPTPAPKPPEKIVRPEDAARAFYAKVTKRDDIRELLKRLSDR